MISFGHLLHFVQSSLSCAHGSLAQNACPASSSVPSQLTFQIPTSSCCFKSLFLHIPSSTLFAQSLLASHPDFVQSLFPLILLLCWLDDELAIKGTGGIDSFALLAHRPLLYTQYTQFISFDLIYPKSKSTLCYCLTTSRQSLHFQLHSQEDTFFCTMTSSFLICQVGQTGLLPLAESPAPFPTSYNYS